jgi:phospholipase C
VPLGSATSGPLADTLATGNLPNFSFVTPNLCDDAHSCPVASGDRWLAQFVPTILASPSYQAGAVAVFLTYDEGTSDNHVPTIVIAPTVPTSTVSHTAFSHYSLLLTTEQLLGLPALGSAAAAASMRADFHL